MGAWPVAAEQVLPVAGEADIVAARQAAREIARSLGFGMVDQSRITTAVSELTRNVVRYATDGRGRVVIRELTSPAGRAGVTGGSPSPATGPTGLSTPPSVPAGWSRP